MKLSISYPCNFNFYPCNIQQKSPWKIWVPIRKNLRECSCDKYIIPLEKPENIKKSFWRITFISTGKNTGVLLTESYHRWIINISANVTKILISHGPSIYYVLCYWNQFLITPTCPLIFRHWWLPPSQPCLDM